MRNYLFDRGKKHQQDPALLATTSEVNISQGYLGQKEKYNGGCKGYPYGGKKPISFNKYVIIPPLPLNG